MKRCSACIGILAGLILLCITSLLVVRRECNQFVALSETVVASVQTGSTEYALQQFDALYAGWERFHNICGLFVNGEKLDPIRDLLSGLRPLIETNHPETVSTLEKLRGLIEAVYEEEFPALWHIL